MMCDCIEVMNTALSAHNTKLALMITFGGKGDNTFPLIGVEQVEKGRGKSKAKSIVPNYCCFCGNAYSKS